MDELILIARVKAGRFEAWFDKASDRHFEVTVYDKDKNYAEGFSTEAEAREFWHELTTAKGFQHCYCCN
jgi:hypothetical protein